jgi:hypothetical protein
MTSQKYIEDAMPRSGWDSPSFEAAETAYKNAMIGRAPTPYADYAYQLRERHRGVSGQNARSFLMLADLICRFHGEERSLKFWDFFPSNATRYRIDDRTASPHYGFILPVKGWQLDQDRSCVEANSYDEWGYAR